MQKFGYIYGYKMENAQPMNEFYRLQFMYLSCMCNLD